jgi:transposase
MSLETVLKGQWMWYSGGMNAPTPPPSVPIRKPYPSDLREAEWTILEPLVPAVKPGGRPARHSRREIVNAILYVVRGGNQWRAMPHDLPPWQTAFYYFRIWRNDGTWEQIHSAIREQARRRAGREATPSAAIVDSQSVKTSQRGARAATTRTSR